MTTGNAEKLKRLYEGVWNEGDLSVADDLVSKDYVIHDRDIADEVSGPALYKRLASMTRDIFPDMRIEIADFLADGDKVAVRWTMTGTHKGELFGVPPTDDEVVLSAIEINRFDGGLLVETWTQSDQIGLMEQVGALEKGN